MAFTVTRHGNGYKISVGDHKPTRAESIREITNALEHYYMGHGPQMAKEECPFCRQVRNAY